LPIVPTAIGVAILDIGLIAFAALTYPPGANTDIADKLIKKWGVESLNV
jgi:hypothetical protein